MPDTNHKPELLAPAGNFEKLEVAIDYGADAVYLAGKSFSLRNFSGNFTDSELERAILFAHSRGVKVYLACNIFSRNSEQKDIADFLGRADQYHPDAVIIADPGIVYLAKKTIPHIPIHLSTQANTTNYNAVRFWENTGIQRINLARELPLPDIKEINHCISINRCSSVNPHISTNPGTSINPATSINPGTSINPATSTNYCASIETETFIHGAMCISYSGRCLLSSVLSGRDSNRGLCSHPCRWKYSVVEEQRPGEFHPLLEDDRGAYIFNSKDLCMIDHIPKLFDAQITSLKIEGRMKGVSYLASVVRTYREAIDLYASDPENYAVKSRWHEELDLIYHRPYCTGFYFNSPDKVLSNYQNHHNGKIHNFTGRIIKVLPENKVMVSIRNKISVENDLEVLPPAGPPLKSKLLAVFDQYHTPVTNAQPNSISILQLEFSSSSQFIGLIVRKV